MRPSRILFDEENIRSRRRGIVLVTTMCLGLPAAPSSEQVLKTHLLGNSLAVQWLGPGAFTAGAQVQSLVGELRSYRHGQKTKKTENKQKKHIC